MRAGELRYFYACEGETCYWLGVFSFVLCHCIIFLALCRVPRVKAGRNFYFFLSAKIPFSLTTPHFFPRFFPKSIYHDPSADEPGAQK